MIVDISKISVKKIRELIVFTAFLVVALWKFDVVLDVPVSYTHLGDVLYRVAFGQNVQVDRSRCFWDFWQAVF